MPTALSPNHTQDVAIAGRRCCFRTFPRCQSSVPETNGGASRRATSAGPPMDARLVAGSLRCGFFRARVGRRRGRCERALTRIRASGEGATAVEDYILPLGQDPLRSAVPGRPREEPMPVIMAQEALGPQLSSSGSTQLFAPGHEDLAATKRGQGTSVSSAMVDDGAPGDATIRSAGDMSARLSEPQAAAQPLRPAPAPAPTPFLATSHSGAAPEAPPHARSSVVPVQDVSGAAPLGASPLGASPPHSAPAPRFAPAPPPAVLPPPSATAAVRLGPGLSNGLGMVAAAGAGAHPALRVPPGRSLGPRSAEGKGPASMGMAGPTALGAAAPGPGPRPPGQAEGPRAQAPPFLAGMGMLGMHPLLQMAWGPFSAHLGPHRAAQLQRYRYKRMLRLQALARGERKIRYQCRKQLADARPRVKGRFAKIHGPDGLLAKQAAGGEEEGAPGPVGAAVHEAGPPAMEAKSTSSGSAKSTSAERGTGGAEISGAGPGSPGKGMRRSRSKVGLNKGLEVPSLVKGPKLAQKVAVRRPPRGGAVAKPGHESAFLRAAGGMGAMSRVMSEMDLSQLDQQAESALDDIGLGNWSGEGLEDQGLAFPGAGVVGDADDYLGTLSKREAHVLLREVAAADMRRSFSDTNLLTLDTSRLDFESTLDPLHEDDEFALPWR